MSGCRNIIPTPIVINQKGSRIIACKLQINFQFNLTKNQAIPQSGPEFRSFGTVLAKNTCTKGVRLPVYHSKVNIGPQTVSQSLAWAYQINVQSNFIIFYQTNPRYVQVGIEYFLVCSDPKQQCSWLQTGGISIKSQFQFMNKIRETQNVNHR